MAEAMVCSKDQPVSLKTLEEDFEKDIRQWTSAGFQLVDMYKLISVRLAPLYLGQTGRRKVKICTVLYLVRILLFFYENINVVDCDGAPPLRVDWRNLKPGAPRECLEVETSNRLSRTVHVSRTWLRLFNCQHKRAAR